MSSPRPTRRTFLGTLLGGGALLVTGGCGYYSPGAGAPYALWDFPGSSEGDLRLVHAAVLAASPHNTQPWLFALDPDRVLVLVDDTRTLGAMDPLGRERRIGVGCALENLVIAARRFGRAPVVRPAADTDAEDLVAEVALGAGPTTPDPLFDAIPRRRTNRSNYGHLPLDRRIPDELARLVADLPDVAVHVLTSREDRAAFAAATVAATRAIIADREMLLDSDAWYRHSREDIERHRDGVTLDAQGLSAWFTGLAKMSGRPSASDGGDYWLDNTRAQTGAVSAFGLLSTPALDDRAQALAVGRAWQRIHLWLTANGLAAQPLNQLAERRDRELTQGATPDSGATLARWVPPERHAQMLFRVGIPWDAVGLSPRRALTDVVAVAP